MIRLKTLLSIIWLATETNWGKRGVGPEDAKGNFVIFQTTRCAALNPLSWSAMHHLPSSNLSIRIKTTDLVTNNISSNWKTVNISVQAENMHKVEIREMLGEKKLGMHSFRTRHLVLDLTKASLVPTSRNLRPYMYITSIVGSVG